MLSGLNELGSYAVEVSGWNLEEDFFVEQTKLRWNDYGHKVTLHHAMREGSLVFIRLLGDDAASPHDNAIPVAYETVSVAYSPQQCTYEIALLKVKPKFVAESRVPANNETTQEVLR